MAELIAREHLQPSLLDRLTDEKPSEETEEFNDRVMSLKEFRKSVLRDLTWLLNTGCIETCLDLSNHTEAKRSVINYGIPDLSGTWARNKDRATMERDIRQAILAFEPRILRETLKVSVAINHEVMNANTMTFEIQGELWWQPVPERFYLKTILDLELGKFKADI